MTVDFDSFRVESEFLVSTAGLPGVGVNAAHFSVSGNLFYTCNESFSDYK